jgi:hypothetical protein
VVLDVLKNSMTMGKDLRAIPNIYDSAENEPLNRTAPLNQPQHFQFNQPHQTIPTKPFLGNNNTNHS